MINTALYFCQSNPCILNRKNDQNSKKREKFCANSIKGRLVSWNKTSILKNNYWENLYKLLKKEKKRNKMVKKLTKLK